MFLRGIVEKFDTAFKGVISVFGEKVEVERFGVYGLFSKPRIGSKAVLMRRGDSIVVIADNDKRISIDLQDGEVALSDGVSTVHIKTDGIHVNALQVFLGPKALESAAMGVLTGSCVCSITGAPHAGASMTVKATL